MNVLKHAAATTCRVRLAAVDAHLELDVEDDGVGAVAGRSAGVGLASMRERAAELGGDCAVSVRPGGGTRVAVRCRAPGGDPTWGRCACWSPTTIPSSARVSAPFWRRPTTCWSSPRPGTARRRSGWP